MKILINEVLADKKKTLYWLKEETGLSYPTVFNLANGKNKQVAFDTLDLICAALNCEIEDILKANE